jgi:hypothetical protein
MSRLLTLITIISSKSSWYSGTPVLACTSFSNGMCRAKLRGGRLLVHLKDAVRYTVVLYTTAEHNEEIIIFHTVIHSKIQLSPLLLSLNSEASCGYELLLLLVVLWRSNKWCKWKHIFSHTIPTKLPESRAEGRESRVCD